MPEIAAHERDAVSFWFRRILTTLAVANGAGILALSSFISSSKDLRVAAIIAYPTLSYFLTGAIITFACFAISFIWAGTRGDAYGEYFAKIGEAIKTWKKPERSLYYTYIFIFTFVFFGQLIGMFASGFCFYIGSSEIVNGLGAVACSTDKSLPYCKSGASFLFARDKYSQYSDDEMALKHAMALGVASAAVQQTPGPSTGSIGGDFILNQIVSANPSKPSARMKIPEAIDLALTSDKDPILNYAIVTARILIIRPTSNDIECRVKISNFYAGDSSPLILNPDAENFLRLDGKLARGSNVRISIQTIFINSKFKTPEGSEDYDAFVIEHGATYRRDMLEETARSDGYTDATVSAPYSNGLLILTHRKKPSAECSDAAKILGWPVI